MILDQDNKICKEFDDKHRILKKVEKDILSYVCYMVQNGENAWNKNYQKITFYKKDLKKRYEMWSTYSYKLPKTFGLETIHLETNIDFITERNKIIDEQNLIITNFNKLSKVSKLACRAIVQDYMNQLSKYLENNQIDISTYRIDYTMS